MSLCVLDASFVFPWLFEDESSPEADAVLALVGERGAVVPSLWFTEVANGLGMAERRNRVTGDEVREALALLEDLKLTVDDEPRAAGLPVILDLMRAHRLTAYDATYLELAMRCGLPLATNDGDLKTAATAVGLALLAAAP